MKFVFLYDKLIELKQTYVRVHIYIPLLSHTIKNKLNFWQFNILILIKIFLKIYQNKNKNINLRRWADPSTQLSYVSLFSL